MSKFERRYKSGEIIFREGEPSTSAFIVTSGQVELVKRAGSRMTRIAMFKAGDLFGEMGLIDRSLRDATARAVGIVTVDVIRKDEFLSAIQKRPDVALSIIGNLSERLNKPKGQANVPAVVPAQTSQLPAKRAATPLAKRAAKPTAQSQPASKGFWGFVDYLLAQPERRAKMVTILVMPIAGANGKQITPSIVEALKRYPGVRPKVVDEPFFDPDGKMTLSELLIAARGRMKQAEANLLIWGAVNDSGTTVHLRFISHQLDEDPPGAFLPSDRLALPVPLTRESWDLLAAVAFAATVSRVEAHRQLLRRHLTPAFESARNSRREPPMELNHADRATVQACYGNIAAQLGYQSGDVNWYREAALAYQEALDGLSQETTPLDWATVQRHLGTVRQVLGEKRNDAAILENAAEALESALSTFTLEAFPWDWAALHARLGSIYYRLDGLKRDGELLKRSVAAFQNALQIYSRNGAPMRWAEVKNNLSQSLQVLGDLSRSTTNLKRAVEACHEALQVRSREVTPVLWASTQNNLGSALFLLARQTEDPEHLEGAAEAFGMALEVYRKQGFERLASVAERNMAKAEQQLRARLARRVANVYWENEVVDIETAAAEAQKTPKNAAEREAARRAVRRELAKALTRTGN